jgi:heat shock protein HslJ
MQQEEDYTAVLLKAQSFALDGTTLVITSAEGTLQFTRA